MLTELLRLAAGCRCRLLLPFALCLAVSAAADDWPQWLGPQRDAVWRETGIVERFPASGLKFRWRTPIGAGYSGPAVAAGRVYVMDRQLPTGAANPGDPFTKALVPGIERVLCLEETTGKILWTHAYDAPYTISYAAGPRCTPLVDGDRVFTLGAEGNLFCLDAASGRPIWSRDFKRDFGAKTPEWGFAGHPLLVEDRLVCLVGGDGSVAVAFDKHTGKELWRALSAREPGYGPPTLIEYGGRRMVIVWHPEAVNALDPATGQVLWTVPFESRYGLTAPTPRLAGDMLFVTAFYNGSLALRLGSGEPQVLWRSPKVSEKDTTYLHSIIATPFIEGGHIYGVCSYGQLRCLKLETGERVWETLAATTPEKETRWGNAFLVKHGDRFLLANERGDLIIARLTPAGYDEISRTRLIEPTNRDPGRPVVWSHPAFANRSVYARNDREIVCASLAEE
ncbi:MAG: PQQ-binding-like beta-propeller repeat protein [Verrucomicrobia bacterium]|nr:PQQ-binding-like beta-propeller repeat protein [Verrucomicrobiota bacterium]